MKVFIAITLLIFISLSINIQSQIIQSESGLAAHYPFNGNANDESGNENDGIVYGATLTDDRFGNPNSAYNFDGFNDYIAVPHHPSLTPPAYTVNVWYKSNSHTLGEIITKSIDKHYYEIQYIDHFNSGCLEYWYEDEQDQDIYIISEKGCDTQYYHMATMIFFDSTLVAFLNACLIDSLHADILPYNNGDGLYFGTGNDGFFHGIIDDIVIYNRPLSKEEIDSLYNVNPFVNINTPATLVDDESINIYPNPCSGNMCFLVTRYATRITSIDIFDISGRSIRNLFEEVKITGEYEMEIDVSGMPAGVYYFRIQAGNKVGGGKMVKMK